MSVPQPKAKEQQPLHALDPAGIKARLPATVRISSGRVALSILVIVLALSLLPVADAEV